MLRKKKGPCTLGSHVRIQVLKACALGFAVARLGAVLWFLELISESVAFYLSGRATRMEGVQASAQSSL